MRTLLLALVFVGVCLTGAIVVAWPGGSSQAQGGGQTAGALAGLVAFESDRFGNSDVFLQRNGETVRVTDAAAQQGQPAFGCDDHTMYIVSNQNGPLRIWRATAGVSWDDYTEGGQVQLDELTSGFVQDNAPAVYCGAQSYVFFSRFPLCGTCDADIWRMGLDGGNAINLTNNPATDGAPVPYIAADGTPSVVFSSDRDGDYDIYSMDMNGGNVQQITNNPAFDYYPSVGIDSDGGHHLFFSSDRDGNAEIYAQDLGTGAAGIGSPVRLTNNPAADIDPVADLAERVAELEATVVFTRVPAGGTADLLSTHFNGSGEAPLVTHTGNDSAAAWKASGQGVPTLGVIVAHKQDETGAPLEGWQFDLYVGSTCSGALIDSAATEEDGDAIFTGLQDGPYAMGERMEPGWTPLGQTCRTAVIGPTTRRQVLIFVNQRPGITSTPTPTPIQDLFFTPVPTATPTYDFCVIAGGSCTPTPTPRPRRGDSNGDGQITAIDAALDLQFSAGLIHSLPPTADANLDGHVNSIDATLKLQHVAGLYEIPVM